MNRFKFMLIIFIASFFVLSVMSVSFATPTNTYAHPAFGFTPQPPPPPGGGGGGGSDDGDKPGGGGGGTEPTDTVIVEIDRCDLSCSVEYVDAGGSEVLIASVDGAYLPAQNLAVSSSPLPDVEVLVPVQLVHQGSGFIIDQTLSDSRSTTISVPYAGQWEVFMVNAPQFVTDDLMDMTGLNVAQLQADLANDPVSLGMVQANAGPQLVKCPIECVLEEQEEAPAYLPETGQDKTTSYLLLAAGIFIVSVLVFQRFRVRDHARFL
jgi:LPXTG-motif cell wall-anchored protein